MVSVTYANLYVYIYRKTVHMAFTDCAEKELQSNSICGLSSDSMWRQLVFILLQDFAFYFSFGCFEQKERKRFNVLQCYLPSSTTTVLGFGFGLSN